MIVVARDFSGKSAIVGAIIGASIGLGLINVDLAFSLGAILAFVFGYGGAPAKMPVKRSSRKIFHQ